MDFRHVNSGYWVLRIAFGLGPLLAGLDKFTNILTQWTKYLNPQALQIVPVSAATFMHAVGVLEIIVGGLILLGASRVFGYIAMIWLLCIAGNLISIGYYDIAVRDILLACGAFTLAQLTQAHRAVVMLYDYRESRRAA